MLRIELRHSVMAPLALLLTVAGCRQALAGAGPHWLGRGQDTLIVLGTFGTLIVGPAAIACAAWTVHRAERAGMGDVLRLGARDSLSKTALPALAVWMWAAVAVLVPMGCGAVRTWFASGATPSVLLLVLPLTVLAAQVTFGVVVAVVAGRSLLVCVVSPLGFYGFYFFQVAQDMSASGWRRLLPVLQEIWDPLYVADTWRLLVVMLFLVTGSVAVLALCAAVRYGRVGAWRPVAVAAAAAVAAGTTVAVTPPAAPTSYYGQPRTGGDYVCTARPSARVCLWRPDAVFLPVLADAMDRALGSTRRDTSMGSTPDLPRTLTEEGIILPDDPAYAEVAVISPPNLAATTDEVRSAIVGAMGSSGTSVSDCRVLVLTSDPALGEGQDPAQFFARVFADRLGLTVPYELDPRVIREFEALPIEVQNSWLGTARVQMATCQPVSVLPVNSAE